MRSKKIQRNKKNLLELYLFIGCTDHWIYGNILHWSKLKSNIWNIVLFIRQHVNVDNYPGGQRNCWWVCGVFAVQGTCAALFSYTFISDRWLQIGIIFVKYVFEITQGSMNGSVRQYSNEDQNDAEQAVENITNGMQALKIDESNSKKEWESKRFRWFTYMTDIFAEVSACGCEQWI